MLVEKTGKKAGGRKRKTRESSSLNATERIIERTDSFGRKYGIYRSFYERAFAEYLTEYGIAFKFEPHGFKIENYAGVKLHYIPDFFIPKLGIFIEILNGPVGRRLKNKMFLMQEQHKLIRFVLITKKHLHNLFEGKNTLEDLIGVSSRTLLNAMRNKGQKQQESQE